jgi:DNA invertase Pin-like site-specific DNA recombinase
MNYWWDTHAYQQSNKISPPSTTLGVGDDRIYVDHGLTGTNLDRPGLRLALAACRTGDTLVVTKLDRQARSLPAARDILDELTRRNVKLSLGGSIHDPTDPVGRLLFNVLAMVAEFRIRPDPTTHPGRNEGSQGQGSAARQAAKAEAEPRQAPAREARLRQLQPSRTRRTVRVGRSTIYRTIDRMRPQLVEPERPFGHLEPNTQTSTPRKSCPTE